ncbi:P-loop containing nucleoside triphosphate hydrolase [Pseudocohnilembus persalinus]|uniref:p-loop containing nucleoside triphosphate hydrolase n=1 Tax=Pseudocohnilembus persalinus TaxID=266149 RepID=A0A0V0QX47_PSEPJ|nr:P-loop containing nucleoside triphosphate hydrolase [Pseudocohnilembus persalinus]|eukprot:KRX06969.1 P-loop containing nucleoside triphosphate hydrolase [Pseudocohnilembus persalinus]
MGNNHNKYFNEAQRKIVLIGIENSGKTSLIKFLKKELFQEKYEPTKDADYHDIDYNIEGDKKKKIQIIAVDNGGAQRQRIFWRHQYIGSQGIIYMINPDENSINESLQEFENLLKEESLQQIPIAVLFSKSDLLNLEDQKEKQRIQLYIDSVTSIIAQVKNRSKIEIFQISNKTGQNIQKMSDWLIKQTVEI